MPEKLSTAIVSFIALIIGAGLLAYLVLLPAIDEPESAATSTKSRTGRLRSTDSFDFRVGSRERQDAFAAMADAFKLAELERLFSKPGAIDGEAVLRFADADAYNRFLEDAARLGLRVLGSDSQHFALRIGFDEAGDLLAAFSGLDPSDYEIGANFLVTLPTIPSPDDPANPGQVLFPFGPNTLNYLGVTNNTTWGEGITIAILDTGIGPHNIFGEDQVTAIDFLGTSGGPLGEVDHGTAVASLVAELAPASSILDYAVMNESGTSDSFTLSLAIYDAIARGADVINISLGSYGSTIALAQAVADAVSAGIAVVAAAGNDGLEGRLTYPAAYPGVISAGAVDALSQHVYYSNTSENLSLSAPGVGITAAAPENGTTSASGTSFSSPLIGAAVTAILSENPGMTSQEAEALLYTYANEAGIPGPDPEYGNGILNLERVMQRNTPGIYDIAIASQTFANPNVPTNNANPFIDIAVQNRGTETLYNVSVQVSSPGIARTFNIPVLAPNEVAVLQAPINAALVQANGSLEVVSTASMTTPNVVDANQRNNRQTTSVNIVGATPSAPVSNASAMPQSSGGIQ